jgi:hypothetical protein
MQVIANHLNPAENRLSKANHHSAETAVRHEQIGAATNHDKFYAPFTTKLKRHCKVRLRARLKIKLRRPTHPQGGVFGHRLIAPNSRRWGKAGNEFIH